MADAKVPMREQAPDVRAKNFDEVALGYSADEAVREAKRCLNCKRPACVEGCPVGVNIPGFISKLKADDAFGAAALIGETNALPAVCGRVCPQEEQCEKHCVLGRKGESVAIGRLERFAADEAMKRDDYVTSLPQPEGKRVAVVGAGPAGLCAAGSLARKGYRVTVYESFHKAGGVLIYGIPEFRLPKAVVQKEIDGLKQLGVEFEFNVIVGRTATIEDLFNEGNEAVFIGTGAGLPRFMDIPGENLNGVCSANELLSRVNLMGAWMDGAKTPVLKAKRVAVVGGGNVAMDAARVALRLGAEKVWVVYRRTEEEMPARAEEVHHAKEEGIQFMMLSNPVEIKGDGWAEALICERMALGEPDATGRRRPVSTGEHFTLDIDCCVMAIGTTPNPLILQTTEGLESTRKGCIMTDDKLRTSRKLVYAGGDAVTGAATVILAMGAGRAAAEAIDEELRESN